MGTVEPALAAQMARDGVAFEVLKPKPKVNLGLSIYLEAFFELDTERQIGMSIGRIPWHCIVQYGHYYEMNVEELLFFVRKMDDAYLDRVARKQANG